MRILSHLDWIFSLGHLTCVVMENDLLEIGIFDKQSPAFHAHAYPDGHVTPVWLFSLYSLVPIRMFEACLFISDCWRQSGTTSGAMHTTMLRKIIVLVSLYIVRASSHEYKDGVVMIFALPVEFRNHLMYEDSVYPCLYHTYTRSYCQDAESEEGMGIIMKYHPKSFRLSYTW